MHALGNTSGSIVFDINEEATLELRRALGGRKRLAPMARHRVATAPPNRRRTAQHYYIVIYPMGIYP
jgi:hypothetical protein